MSLASLTKRPVQTVDPSRTLIEAARLMCKHSVGALVVTDATGVTPIGILTDRDLVWMVAEGLEPKKAEVGQFVQGELQTALVTESLADVARKMRDHGVRRLPIVDQERRLLGIVSLDDLIVLIGRELADVATTIGGELDHERQIGSRMRS